MLADSQKIELAKEEENLEKNWSEILDKRLSELIEKVKTMQMAIKDLSGPLQQLLKDIRISIYQIENPFSYVSQVAQIKPDVNITAKEKNTTEQNEKAKNSPTNHLARTIDMLYKMLQHFDEEDTQRILDLLTEADLLSPKMRDFLKEVPKKLQSPNSRE